VRILNDTRRQCSCSPTQVRRYQSRLSGPLLDRIDLHLEVPRLSVNELMGRTKGESSAEVRQRVCRARAVQTERLKSEGISCNAQMGPRLLREACVLAPGAGDLLKSAINQLSLSARAYDRILKVGRTIADLDSSPDIQLHHIAEAINYRTLDRKYFGGS
jgi:magnesium chelatase family protein